MAHVEKTVFISYRRTNAPWALAIFQYLNNNGYDVFFDYNGIASGDFESAILGNIKARAHFLVLLTPSALERCGDSRDWLRREIETALETKRNIVPLMLEGFDFSTPAIANQLTGKLADLNRYQALGVPAEYFMEAMQRLCQRYLNVALDAVLHPPSSAARQAAQGQQAAADTAPAVAEEELTALQWFERGFETMDPEEEIRFFSQAIRLKPDFAEALYNRGLARQNQGDLPGAILDYDKAIRLQPDDAEAFFNRALAHYDQSDLASAIKDYGEAIRIKPGYAKAFSNRGLMRQNLGDLKGALKDYNVAIRLNPHFAEAFINRGSARQDLGDLTGALKDYNMAIRLRPDYAGTFNNRAIVRLRQDDLASALKDYNQAIRLEPNYVDVLYNRGELFREKGDYQAAITDFQKYLDIGGGVRGGDQAEVEQMIRDLRKKLEAKKNQK